MFSLSHTSRNLSIGAHNYILQFCYSGEAEGNLPFYIHASRHEARRRHPWPCARPLVIRFVAQKARLLGKCFLSVNDNFLVAVHQDRHT